jgi:hypothetical protein
MLARLKHPGDDERLQLLGGPGELFELQPDMGQRVGYSSAEAAVSR